MKSKTFSYWILIVCIVISIKGTAQTKTILFSNTIGEVNYEAKDHRSNVYEVVSDRKTIHNNQFKGIIIAATDYYPYGSEIGTRSFSGDYKYGFQGQEKDEEVKGKGNSNNYKYRMHDSRVGRFFAVDPLAGKYPYNSVYAFSENTVVNAVELEGLEKNDTVTKAPNSKISFPKYDPEQAKMNKYKKEYERLVNFTRFENGKVIKPITFEQYVLKQNEIQKERELNNKHIRDSQNLATGWAGSGDGFWQSLIRGPKGASKLGKQIWKEAKRKLKSGIPENKSSEKSNNEELPAEEQQKNEPSSAN